MSLDNISYCRYLTDISQDWRPEHWRVWNLVQAIKGHECNGYAFLEVGGVRKRVDSKNPQVAIDWFADRVVSETKFGSGNYILCPIPGSQCTPTSTDITRTVVLAESLSKRLPQLKVWPNLKFKKPMQRKIRDEEVLFNNLVCTASVPSGYIILLDDVCTTGAHARAAQRRLQGTKGNQMCAMSVARTMLNRDEDVFGFRLDHL
jgi:hypothetical protein